MGDHAISDSTFSSFEEVRTPGAPDAGIPPQILARWAALASARACSGMVPRQVVGKA